MCPDCMSYLGIRDDLDCCGRVTILCGPGGCQGGKAKRRPKRPPFGACQHWKACVYFAIYGTLQCVGCIRYIGCTIHLGGRIGGTQWHDRRSPGAARRRRSTGCRNLASTPPPRRWRGSFYSPSQRKLGGSRKRRGYPARTGPISRTEAGVGGGDGN